MGIAVWALIAYVVTIIAWNGVFKRNIGEALIVGFLLICVFGGRDCVQLFASGLADAFSEDVVFAAVAFVFMGFLLTKLGLIEDQVALLNRAFGRFRGGAGYVSTVASALLGSAAGSGAGIASSVGSVTIPWMIRTNWQPDLAASLVAGNAGLGISIPPSSSMFLLLGSAAVAPVLSANQLFSAALVGGLWTVLYRLMVVFCWVRLYGIGAVNGDQPEAGAGPRPRWSSLLVYLGLIVPIFLTTDWGEGFLSRRVGEAADTVSIIVWIPVVMMFAAVLVGWRRLPRSIVAWDAVLTESAPRYALIGTAIVFAFAAAAALGSLGLVEQLRVLMDGINAPLPILATGIGLLIVLIAAPLTGTATIAAVGGVAFSALTAAGVPPAVAATAILVFASTEGASPPGAAPIYIATSIAGIDPARTFVRLVVWFVLPIVAIGVAIASGLLPIFVSF
ncbi:TRAP transporter large permease subunit [Novosphingobium mathurense]|uniref:TRAP-type C4-dicarboxylate transport system, large permease component n=1 Tax=Novosphingobium mathurense TaxID=428990 RepID=A0A1U6IL45_9SPHN|nr:TRAP transporter large permease subunit [Novosphingobium mathurense]SLK08738.1 TRAP-type C4-dicarboxylate transport system, large permease component [Novosphingobium mathurense]